MTSIAFDGEYIAADSLCSCNGVVVDDNYNKIHTFKEEIKFKGEKILCIVLSGELNHITGLVDLIREGQTKFDDGEYIAYIVTENACYRVEDEGRWYKDTAKRWALGSGKEFALSAMVMGKSAKEAVKHACKLDVYSGGKIRVLKVRDKKKKQIKNNKKVVMKPAKREDVERVLNKVMEQYKGAIDNLAKR